jgi:hypothetical protein
MKYTGEIVTRKPVNEVIRLFDDPENMGRWMPALLSFERISGSRTARRVQHREELFHCPYRQRYELFGRERVPVLVDSDEADGTAYAGGLPQRDHEVS